MVLPWIVVVGLLEVAALLASLLAAPPRVRLAALLQVRPAAALLVSLPLAEGSTDLEAEETEACQSEADLLVEGEEEEEVSTTPSETEITTAWGQTMILCTS